MHNSFRQIPNDPETTVLFQLESCFDDIPACYQSWHFDGIRGESIIFRNQDLKHRNDTDLIDKVKASRLVQKNTPVTLSRNPPGFLFINFNIRLEG